MSCGAPRLRRAVALGAAAFAICSTGAALACGLEDPSSIAMLRGSLNIAYPESLHVGTAVWQAQLAGKLPRDPIAKRGDLSPEARGALRLARAQAKLRDFAAKLADAGPAGARPALAVVLLGPVMWSRFETDRGKIAPHLHVDGPERGDVVLVTDVPVIEAIAAGKLGFADALSLGLMRLYGPAADVAAARTWLADRARG